MTDMELLISKLEEANAKKIAWMAEGPDRWTGLYSTDPVDWIERGIVNIAQFDRDELETMYYEMHRDAYSYRPSGYREMTNEQLQAEIDEMSVIINRQIAEETVCAAVIEFEARVADTMELIVGSTRESAIRVIFEAEGNGQDDFDFYGWEQLEYQLGLPYGYVKGTL